MTIWPRVKLGEVGEIVKGSVDPQRFPEVPFAHYSIPAFDDGKGPILEIGEAIKSQKTLIESPIVLVSKLNPRIPRVWHVDDAQTCQRICSTEFVPIRGSAERLDSCFLTYALKHSLTTGEITGSTSAATKSRERAKPTDFLKLEIPLPQIPEQRHIVDLLSRADGIVRLRREAEKKAAELIPALFVDMFGDPALNLKGWPVRKVSDFVSRFEGGKNIQAGSENGSPYRILKVSAVTSGVYRESESKPSPDSYNPPVSHIVRAGDMLFSRANTEELVGATAIVERSDGKTLLPDKLWRFVWNEPIEKAYMHALFQSIHVRHELGKLSSGTSASMRNISQSKLFNLTLPIAPFANQKDFAEKAAAVRSIQSQQSAALAKAKATFDALLAKCFSLAAKA